MAGDSEYSVSKIRTVFIALSVGGAYFVWGLIFSIQPSFYPSEAESKGATPSQYGFVFGIVHLAALCSAPIFARFGHYIGPKLLYNLGGFAQALAAISFGFLDLIDSAGVFLALSYLLRAIDGIADAAAWLSMVSILMVLYPDKVATVMGWTETAFGLGYIIGPGIGSKLYQCGGFRLPFLLTGSLGVICSCAVLIAIPRIKVNRRREELQDSSEDDESQENVVTKPSLTFRDIFKNSSLLLPYVETILIFCCVISIEAMLEPHMKSQAGATQDQVGYAFLIIGLAYTVITPFMGHICDRISYPIIVSMLSNSGMCVALLLFGPAPVIPVEPNVPLILVCCGIMGTSTSFSMVATFSRAHGSAMRQGFADNLKTYILLSGTWSFSLYLGGFIGPTLGGIMVEHIGFRSTTAWFILFQALMLILNIWDFYKDYNRRQSAVSQGYQPIE